MSTSAKMFGFLPVMNGRITFDKYGSGILYCLGKNDTGYNVLKAVSIGSAFAFIPIYSEDITELYLSGAGLMANAYDELTKEWYIIIHDMASDGKWRALKKSEEAAAEIILTSFPSDPIPYVNASSVYLNEFINNSKSVQYSEHYRRFWLSLKGDDYRYAEINHRTLSDTLKCSENYSYGSYPGYPADAINIEQLKPNYYEIAGLDVIKAIGSRETTHLVTSPLKTSLQRLFKQKLETGVSDLAEYESLRKIVYYPADIEHHSIYDRTDLSGTPIYKKGRTDVTGKQEAYHWFRYPGDDLYERSNITISLYAVSGDFVRDCAVAQGGAKPWGTHTESVYLPSPYDYDPRTVRPMQYALYIYSYYGRPRTSTLRWIGVPDSVSFLTGGGQPPTYPHRVKFTYASANLPDISGDGGGYLIDCVLWEYPLKGETEIGEQLPYVSIKEDYDKPYSEKHVVDIDYVIKPNPSPYPNTFPFDVSWSYVHEVNKLKLYFYKFYGGTFRIYEAVSENMPNYEENTIFINTFDEAGIISSEAKSWWPADEIEYTFHDSLNYQLVPISYFRERYPHVSKENNFVFYDSSAPVFRIANKNYIVVEHETRAYSTPEEGEEPEILSTYELGVLEVSTKMFTSFGFVKSTRESTVKVLNGSTAGTLFSTDTYGVLFNGGSVTIVEPITEADYFSHDSIVACFKFGETYNIKIIKSNSIKSYTVDQLDQDTLIEFSKYKMYSGSGGYYIYKDNKVGKLVFDDEAHTANIIWYITNNNGYTPYPLNIIKQ